jgi:hypothetical protein
MRLYSLQSHIVLDRRPAKFEDPHLDGGCQLLFLVLCCCSRLNDIQWGNGVVVDSTLGRLCNVLTGIILYVRRKVCDDTDWAGLGKQIECIFHTGKGEKVRTCGRCSELVS